MVGVGEPRRGSWGRAWTRACVEASGADWIPIIAGQWRWWTLGEHRSRNQVCALEMIRVWLPAEVMVGAGDGDSTVVEGQALAKVNVLKTLLI